MTTDGIARLTIRSALAVTPLIAGPPVVTQSQPLVCAIDMGSNTFKRIVGSFEDGRYEQRNIEKRTLGVGDDIAKHGRISDSKLAEIQQTLTAFKTACEKEGVSNVVAVGTAAFRDAPNGRRAVDIAGKHGITMEIATERRESELAYLVGTLGQDGHAVIDNGSRSVELVSRHGDTLRYLVFNLGYRVAYERFFAAAPDPVAAIAAFRDHLKLHAAQAAFMKGRKGLVGIEFGEMVEELFAPAAVEGRVFTREELAHRLQTIASLRPPEFEVFKKQKDMDRALPRLVVAAFFTEAFGYTHFALTERELGAGLIIEAGLRRR